MFKKNLIAPEAQEVERVATNWRISGFENLLL